ncbi:hypothetical protein DRJ17_03400 [Candidatus Woesearchaeota archaeon]|nr:MAG: hypothetical protein DRJ17_03400 [Candidatus Woesearchaeota archaeon]
MGIVEKLYNQSKLDLSGVWDMYFYFDPGCRFLRFKSVREAIENNERDYFVTQIRNVFFSRYDLDVIQNEFTKAANRGIDALNSLCDKHLTEQEAEIFEIPKISTTLDLFELLKSAREEWIEARQGKQSIKKLQKKHKNKHKPIDHELMFSAYSKVRNFGLGYRILMIDTTPELIHSLEHYGPILEWVEDIFRFRDCKETGLDGLPYSWQTDAGVRVYGSNSPISSRTKILDLETDELKYGSILMKMFNKKLYPNQIKDYVGVEFIVENDKAKRKFESFIRGRIKATDKVEEFKDIKARTKLNPNSSLGYGVTKFILRIPLPRAYVAGHPLGRLIHEVYPVEMQIMTVEDDEIRKTNPEVRHENYKKRQFLSAFPAFFPQVIYEPIIKSKGLE